VVCSYLSQVVPVSTRKGQKVTKTAQVKCKSQQEPNAGFTNAAASEPLKEMCLVLPCKQLHTHFKAAVTLAFTIEDKSTLGSRLCYIANKHAEH
jgi:hypothetical protein